MTQLPNDLRSYALCALLFLFKKILLLGYFSDILNLKSEI